MTAATLALVGSVALWQVRPGDQTTQATTATTHTSGQGMVVEQPATLVPVSDAAIYQQWLDWTAAALLPAEPSAVSDQEMFSQWQQRSTRTAER
jgi:hypothetical protein